MIILSSFVMEAYLDAYFAWQDFKEAVRKANQPQP